MIYRGLYPFYLTHQKAKATDPVKYLASSENRHLLSALTKILPEI